MALFFYVVFYDQSPSTFKAQIFPLLERLQLTKFMKEPSNYNLKIAAAVFVALLCSEFAFGYGCLFPSDSKVLVSNSTVFLQNLVDNNERMVYLMRFLKVMIVSGGVICLMAIVACRYFFSVMGSVLIVFCGLCVTNNFDLEFTANLFKELLFKTSDTVSSSSNYVSFKNLDLGFVGVSKFERIQILDDSAQPKEMLGPNTLGTPVYYGTQPEPFYSCVCAQLLLFLYAIGLAVMFVCVYQYNVEKSRGEKLKSYGPLNFKVSVSVTFWKSFGWFVLGLSLWSLVSILTLGLIQNQISHTYYSDKIVAVHSSGSHDLQPNFGDTSCYSSTASLLSYDFYKIKLFCSSL